MSMLHPFKSLWDKLPHPILGLWEKLPHPFRDAFRKFREHLKEHLKSIFFNVNKYTLIPIMIKLLLDIFSKDLPLEYIILLRLALGFISILFSNLLQIIVEEPCPKDINAFKIIGKQSYISFMQYAGGYIIPTLAILALDFIGIGELIVAGEHTPIIGHFIQLAIWIVGFSVATWLTGLSNFGNKCSDQISRSNNVIGILAIVSVIGYEGYHAFF